MKTYLLLKGENNNNADVIEYHGTLHEAKEHLIDNYINDLNVFILMIDGHRFGEGYHQYVMRWKGRDKKTLKHLFTRESI